MAASPASSTSGMISTSALLLAVLLLAGSAAPATSSRGHVRGLLTHPHDTCADCIKNLLVFGDSISDAGMPHGLWSVNNKTVPYYKLGYSQGRFTDRKVWSIYLSKNTGVQLTSFARGSAMITDVPDSLSTGMTQLATYEDHLQHYGPFEGPSAAVIEFGSNDFLYLAEHPEIASNYTALLQFFNGIVTGIGELASAVALTGVQNVIVVNIPPIDKTPFMLQTVDATTRAQQNVAIQGLNAGINQVVLALNIKFAGVANFTLFDVHALIFDAVADPSFYGLKNVTANCMVTNPPFNSNIPNVTLVSICGKANHYLFWDGIHPAHYMHKVMAGRMQDTLVMNGLLPITTGANKKK